MIRAMLAAAALSGLIAGSPAFAGPCKDAKGRVIRCPPKTAAKTCKPSKYVKCAKVTDVNGRVSYRW